MTTSALVTPISLSNDLLTGAEWSPSHARDLLQLSAEIKARPGRYASSLTGKFIALIFEKPSLRTRVTFDVGIQSMGGSVVFLDHTQASASLGARESIADVARCAKVRPAVEDMIRPNRYTPPRSMFCMVRRV